MFRTTNFLTTNHNGNIVFYDVRGSKLHKEEKNISNSAIYNAINEGNYLCVAGHNNCVSVFDNRKISENVDPVFTIEHNAPVLSISLKNDLLISGTCPVIHSELKITSLCDSETIYQDQLADPIYGTVVSPDSNSFVVASGSQLYYYRGVSGGNSPYLKVCGVHAHTDYIQGIDYSADSNKLITLGMRDDNTVRLWDDPFPYEYDVSWYDRKEVAREMLNYYR